MSASPSFHPPRPATAGATPSLAILSAPGGVAAAVVQRIQARGYAMSRGGSLAELLALDPRPDAIFIAASGLSPAALTAASMPADAQEWPALVFLGAVAHTPCAYPAGVWRDFLSDEPCEAHLDALLDRLACKRRQDAQARMLAGQLESRQRELVAVREEFLRLSSRLSHELQATLKHVSTMSRRLQVAAEPTQVRQLGLIEVAASRGKTVVRDLVSLAQIQVSNVTSSKLELGELVAECVAELGQDLAHVEWRVAKLPAIFGDAGLLNLAIRELLANALKFSGTRDHPCIEVIAIAEAEGTTLEVLDNGVGFDASRAHRLFVPLERLHRSGEFEGNGLGLAMVKAAVERHGGKVSARGRPSGGAAFSIWLPQPQAQAIPPEPTAPPADFSWAVLGRPAKRRILLIDDDRLVLAIVGKMLRRDGHEVQTADHGESGLALLRGSAGRFDMVICDWQLPGADGPTVAAEVKRIDSLITTVLLTGRALRPGDFTAQASVDVLLSKPVTTDALRRVVGARPGLGPHHRQAPS